MEALAVLKLINIVVEGVKVGQNIAPLFQRVADLAKHYEDPNRPDVTLESFDKEIEAMRDRSARIQDTSGDAAS